jgi:hypothetical protein
MAMFYSHGGQLFTISQMAAGAAKDVPVKSPPLRRTLAAAAPSSLPVSFAATSAPPAAFIAAPAIAAPPVAAPAAPAPAPAGGVLVEFQPVGLYKPLTVMVHEVWTGKYPPTPWLFQPVQSMLLTSSMKGLLQTSSAPRALNFLTDQLPTAHRRLNTVQAPQPGSPLVCYIPAVTQNLYSLTIEMGFNTFNQDLFNAVSSLLSQAGSFPLFMPYSSYIMAASTISKLAGDLGHLLFNAGIVLSHSQPLAFGLAGAETVKAGYYLLVPDSADGAAVASTYQISPTGQLVDPNGPFYADDVPYVIISIDGTQQDDSYKNFTPLAATADQLSTFFNIADNSTQVVTDAVQGAQLANDLVYRQKADAIQKKINGLPADSPDLANLKTQLAAYVANIQSTALKPPGT